MLNHLTPMLQTSGHAALVNRVGDAPTARPVAAVAETGSTERLADRRSLDGIVQQAARDLFPGREVAVESFYDKASGRFVHRIADGESGEILAQTPSDSLLRFFASGRQPFGEPLLRLEA